MRWTVVDLFSGAGGMSYGFHAHPHFDVVAAVDAQVGKPSSGKGTLGCNTTYAANVGIEPFECDLSQVDGPGLARLLSPALGQRDLDVMLACPPCTGFSRTNPNNHLRDDPRNSLVLRVAIWVAEMQPKVVVMENARELINGNFSYHYERLRKELRQLGYKVHGSIHLLDRVGLPQKRERALVIAARADIPLRTLEDLWRGYRVSANATTVRRAIGHLPPVEAGEAHPSDPMHVCPKLARDTTRRRLELLPKNGGSWVDLVDHPEAVNVLTPAMKRYVAEGKFGSHPDVYGRLWWDRPAVTIKRECAHVGNGRYSHPEQNRLLTVREMAILQGFPENYVFKESSLANMYRHIGDAVPPLISYQLAWLASWMLSGRKPRIEDVILPGTHLRPEDIVEETTGVQGTLPLFDTGGLAQDAPAG
ncbi:MAG: DNA cytosine methyltransferase [Rubrobacteraceae bacterium]|nr:DNA cytosine methyltransferase [Rubrobacteraceae bacterium]